MGRIERKKQVEVCNCANICDMDLLDLFIQEKLEKTQLDQDRIAKGNLHALYAEWWSEHDTGLDDFFPTRKTFSRQLTQKGFSYKHGWTEGRQQLCWIGVRIRS